MKILEGKKKKYLIIGILLTVALVQAVLLAVDMRHYKAAQLEYDNIRETYVKENASAQDLRPKLTVDMDKLRKQNSDVTGWLYYPYLNLSYPVVKETEIDEYLYKTFDGSENKSGCLYEDVLSSADFCGKHDVIFGHNMKDGSMFGKLKTLTGSSVAFLTGDNDKLYVYTDDKIYQYKVFAYYATSNGSGAYSVVSTDGEYDSFVAFIKRNNALSKPDYGILENRPSILTLSTCSGSGGKEGRFVVHCVKINTWDK